jgi:hypothetical protein
VASDPVATKHSNQVAKAQRPKRALWFDRHKNLSIPGDTLQQNSQLSTVKMMREEISNNQVTRRRAGPEPIENVRLNEFEFPAERFELVLHLVIDRVLPVDQRGSPSGPGSAQSSRDLYHEMTVTRTQFNYPRNSPLRTKRVERLRHDACISHPKVQHAQVSPGTHCSRVICRQLIQPFGLRASFHPVTPPAATLHAR